MKEMDVTVTYSIYPNSLFEFYTNYDLTNHGIAENGQLQLMSSYISRLITSAVNQSVDEFPALAAQSGLKEQQVKTETAQLKAEENKALASTVTTQSLEYQKNEILREAMKNGSIQKMVIINGSKMDFLPNGFTDK
jgi:hypothetical protein